MTMPSHARLPQHFRVDRVDSVSVGIVRLAFLMVPVDSGQGVPGGDAFAES